VVLTSDRDEVDNMFASLSPDDSAPEPCSLANIRIVNNVSSIKETDLGGDNDYNPGF